MEDLQDDQEFLRLSLAIVTDSSSSSRIVVDNKRSSKKRKRAANNNLMISSSSCFEGCEGKVFRLLQVREQMLKLVHLKIKKASSNNQEDEDGSNYKGLHLIHLLLITATAVDENNSDSALQNLTELYQSVSLTGDSVSRVVAYFADGLAGRLLTKKSPFYDMVMKTPTPEEEFLAFTDLYRVSPYYQFAHFTANQSIIEAFEKEEQNNNSALHVIDFDVSHGFQWPSLIQSLSEKATNGNKVSLRITGFGMSLEELQETESRLVSFAKGFRNLVFEFQGLLRGSKVITSLRRKKNETVCVNLVFHLNTLNDSLKMYETLRFAHSLNPSIVILVEQEGSRSPTSFLSRFMESLHYFAAMFDSLDDCLPLESMERLSIEKNHLGKEIKNMLNYDKLDDAKCVIARYDKMETWKGRMESHGFSANKLSSRTLIQAKLLLKIRSTYCAPPPPLQLDGDHQGNSSSCTGFRVFERDDGKAISLGWQDRCLVTASAWHCV